MTVEKIESLAYKYIENAILVAERNPEKQEVLFGYMRGVCHLTEDLKGVIMREERKQNQ